MFDVFFLEGKKKVIGFNVILTVHYLLNQPDMLISLFICFLVSQIEYVKPNPKPLILLAGGRFKWIMHSPGLSTPGSLRAFEMGFRGVDTDLL